MMISDIAPSNALCSFIKENNYVKIEYLGKISSCKYYPVTGLRDPEAGYPVIVKKDGDKYEFCRATPAMK